MAENDTHESAKKRIEIGDLPTEEKELTAEEAKKVKGGATVQGGIFPIKAGDGSVRPGNSLQADDVNSDNESTIAGRSPGK